jgi:membrane fusion protein, multidrug efflux system
MPNETKIQENEARSTEDEVKRLERQLADLKSRRDSPEPPAKSSGPRVVRWIILLAVLAAAGVGITLLMSYLDSYETTDDAQIDGHMNSVSARIDGTLAKVYVDDNQMVKQGDLIAEIDPRDYQVALEQAQANLHNAQAQMNAEVPNVSITETSNQTTVSSSEADIANAQAGITAAERDYEAGVAKVHEAEANSAKAEADVARYKMLVDKDEVSRQEYDQAVAASKATAATVASARASAAASQSVVAQRQAQLAQTQSRLSEAQTNGPRQVSIRQANIATRRTSTEITRVQLDKARLDLSYTKIFAPVSGIVTRKKAEIGQRVGPGQQLMYIVQIDDLWVTANFKETQLRKIHPQQRASIKADSTGLTYEGYVDSVSGATGSIASLLPPENATGNYVKVVQRVPVRIRFKKDQQGLDRLRPGMSVEPKVWMQ